MIWFDSFVIYLFAVCLLHANLSELIPENAPGQLVGDTGRHQWQPGPGLVFMEGLQSQRRTTDTETRLRRNEDGERVQEVEAR